MARPVEPPGPDVDLLSLGPFAGVNRVAPEWDLGPGELREAVNFDLRAQGTASSRAGRVKRLALSDAHSLWALSDHEALVVAAGTLYRVDVHDWQATALVTGLAADRFVSYAEVDGWLYWSNGAQSGCVSPAGVPGAWGMAVPARPRAEALGHGGLAAGIYQVALTYLDATGRESGASGGVAVTVPEGGGIALSQIPQHLDAARVAVYLTEPGGKLFFRHSDIPMEVPDYNLGRARLGVPLETQWASAPLPGQLVRAFLGQMFVAMEEWVLFSLPLRPDLFALGRDYLPQFPGRVTLLEPCGEAGLYVATGEQTYYLSHGEEGLVLRALALPYGAVEGSAVQVPAEAFGLELPGRLPYWTPAGGHAAGAIGLPGGRVHLVGKNAALPVYERGASLFAEREGLRAMITALRARGANDGFAASDRASMTIIRNGVTV